MNLHEFTNIIYTYFKDHHKIASYSQIGSMNYWLFMNTQLLGTGLILEIKKKSFTVELLGKKYDCLDYHQVNWPN